MRLILVRHGESEGNVLHINEGHLPGKLTAAGKNQALLVAKRLKDMKINRIYVSDIVRTRETAKIIVKFHPGVPVAYEPAIRERKFGIHEGAPAGTVRKAVEKLGVRYITYRPLHGESILDVRKRVLSFFKRIKATHENETVLFIFHGGPMTQLILHILGKRATRKTYRAHHPQNTAVTIIDFAKGKKPIVRELNSLRHLAS